MRLKRMTKPTTEGVISKDSNVYPTGWNYQRTKATADYYDARKDHGFADLVEPITASMKKLQKKRSKAKAHDAAVAKFYDNQSDEEMLAELEAAVAGPNTVLVPVPRSILSDVLKYIDKKKKSA